jgi:methionyl-tRNA formyltransferase
MEAPLEIGRDETAGELHDRMARATARLIVAALERLENGDLQFTPQPDHGVTYAAKISKQETRIDWSRPAREVHDHIRGLSPFPGAWCEMEIGGKSERVKILSSRLCEGASGAPGEILDPEHLAIGCGEGAVALTRMQRSGGKPLSTQDFLRGAPVGAVG